MNILFFGAGAIGSLFGARLSRYDDVTLLGREEHVKRIRERGLIIRGFSPGIFYVDAISRLDNYDTEPDIVIVTVKSFDTEKATREIKDRFGGSIYIMSLQNGLDNIEKIKKYYNEERIILGLTTEACTFLKPGEVEHTGIGKTIIGSLKGKKSVLQNLKASFKKAGFETILSKDIEFDMWKKAIINACINPLTAIFEIKNGGLREKTLIEIVKNICRECVEIVRKNGLDLDYDNILGEVMKVIDETSENVSSMFQSIMKKKKTEIDSINGYIYRLGDRLSVNTEINKILTQLIKIREGFT